MRRDFSGACRENGGGERSEHGFIKEKDFFREYFPQKSCFKIERQFQNTPAPITDFSFLYDGMTAPPDTPARATGFHLELTSQKPQRVVICEKLWGSVFFRHDRVLRYIPCVKVVIMRRIPVLRHAVALPRHRLEENTVRFGFAL